MIQLTQRSFARAVKRLSKQASPLLKAPTAPADHPRSLKQQLNMGAFQGLPINKSEPKRMVDFEYKLKTTRFPKPADMFKFYEKNRSQFCHVCHYMDFTHKLFGVIKGQIKQQKPEFEPD